MGEEKSLLEALLCECREDFNGLWFIEALTKDEIGPTQNIKEETLNIINQLLNAGMVAGQYNENGEFEIWHMANKEIITRISNEWQALDRKLNLGDVVWITAPSMLEG